MSTKKPVDSGMPAQPAAGVLDWLLAKFKDNPKAALLGVAVFWGAIIVLYHFFKIGHLPMLAVTDLFGIVLAAAMMGLVLVLVVAIFMLAPGYALVYWARLGLGPRSKTVLCMEHRPRQRWKYADVALITAVAALLAAVLFVVLLIGTEPPLVMILVGLAAIPPLVAVVVAETRHLERFVVAPTRKYWVFFLFQFYCYFVWWSMASIVVLMWRDESETRFFANAGLLVVVSIFLHLLLLAAKHKPMRSKTLIFSGFIGYFLLGTGSLSAGAGKIISYFDLGQMPRVNILLNRTGCDTVNAAWPKRPCVVVQGGNPQAYLLPDVDLLTRIGPHYVIAERGTLADLGNRHLIRVAIRSEDVLGWSRAKEEKPHQ